MNIGRITAVGLMPVLCPNAAAIGSGSSAKEKADVHRKEGYKVTNARRRPSLTCKSEGGGGGGTVLLSLSLSASPPSPRCWLVCT